MLKRLDLPDGAAVPLCDVAEGVGLTGTWGANGEILFASVEGDAIMGVSTRSGTPTALITPDPSRGEVRVNWPWFLPDGRRFLYLSRLRDGSGQLMLGERGRPSQPILSAVSNTQWVDPDYLVFVRDGILVGQRFELATARVVGEPFSIAEPIDYNYSTARAEFATSRTGNVAYQSHTDTARLTWSDRHDTGPNAMLSATAPTRTRTLMCIVLPGTPDERGATTPEPFSLLLVDSPPSVGRWRRKRSFVRLLSRARTVPSREGVPAARDSTVLRDERRSHQGGRPLPRPTLPAAVVNCVSGLLGEGSVRLGPEDGSERPDIGGISKHHAHVDAWRKLPGTFSATRPGEPAHHEPGDLAPES